MPTTVHAIKGERLHIVTDGDSITSGVGSIMGRNWPNQLREGLDRRHTLANVAVPGNTAQQVLDRAATTDAQFKPGFTNIATLLAGTNSFGVGGGTLTAQNIYDTLVSWHQGRRAKGFKTVAMTILPRATADQPANTEERRLALNALIRANWATFSDALVDFDLYPAIGAADAGANTAYYPDKLHPNNAGYTIIAGAVANSLGALGVAGTHDHPQYLTSPLQATVTGANNTALGEYASYSLTTGSGNTHVGYRAGALVGAETTTAIDQVVIGANSGQGDATVSSGITAIGGNARAKGLNAVAIGRSSRAYAANSTAIGPASKAEFNGSVAIGADSTGAPTVATRTDEFRLGTDKHHVIVPGDLAVPTAAPTAPVAGNLWVTDAGLFFRTPSGTTIGPLTTAA